MYQCVAGGKCVDPQGAGRRAADSSDISLFESVLQITGDRAKAGSPNDAAA